MDIRPRHAEIREEEMIKIICTCREGSSLPEGSHFLNCPMLKQNQPTKPEESIGAVELLPCPFCGAPARNMKWVGQDGWKVECGNIDCQSRPHLYFSEENAAKAWNRRSSPLTEKPKSEERCVFVLNPGAEGIPTQYCEGYEKDHYLGAIDDHSFKSPTLPPKTKWKPEEAALITRMKKFNPISAPSRQDVDRLIELIERSLNESAAKDAEIARYREALEEAIRLLELAVPTVKKYAMTRPTLEPIALADLFEQKVLAVKEALSHDDSLMIVDGQPVREGRLE